MQGLEYVRISVIQNLVLKGMEYAGIAANSSNLLIKEINKRGKQQ